MASSKDFISVDIVNESSPIARGVRLRKLRDIIGLNQAEMAKEIGVSRVALSYWENATMIKTGLPSKAAEKVIDLAHKKGVDCDISWLLNGFGLSPFSTSSNYTSNAIVSSLERELQLFLNNNKNSIVLKVETLTMLPFYKVGDFVGGIWQPSDFIDGEKDCIFEYKDKLHLRVVKKAKASGLFDAFSIRRIKDNHEVLDFKNIELKKVAPIIRLWR